MNLLAAAVEALRAARLPHALIGGMALAVHGVARATMDIDLLVASTSCLQGAVWDGVRRAGASVEIRHGDDEDPLAGVVRLKAVNSMNVDIVVGKSVWHADAIGRARVERFQDVDIPVARAADLVLLKLEAGGFQDRWDIAQLLAGADRRGLVAEVAKCLPALGEAARRLWGELSGS